MFEFMEIKISEQWTYLGSFGNFRAKTKIEFLDYEWISIVADRREYVNTRGWSSIVVGKQYLGVQETCKKF